jgi:predicted dehydrogenase
MVPATDALRMSVTNRPRLAILGCGAIAEQYYLPALTKTRADAEALTLIDANPARLEALAAAWGIRHLATSIDAVPHKLDGVVNATPSHLHRATTQALLERGLGVLVEKPLAETAADAQVLVDLAAHRRLPLMVNNLRRIYPAFERIGEHLRNGDLGSLRTLRWREGNRFEWPTVSGFYFHRRTGTPPRGVVLDTGAHVLDVICWWLGGEPELIEARHDGDGGPEALAMLKLAWGNAEIEVVLSALAKQPNVFELVGSDATLSGSYNDFNRYAIRSGARRRAEPIDLGTKIRLKSDVADLLLANFCDCLAGRAAPAVRAADVLPSLRLIDAFYQSARPLEAPWYAEWKQ